jgi:hypothetical protein
MQKPQTQTLPEPEPMVDAHVIAGDLYYSVKGILNLAAQKQLPHYIIGRRTVRFKRSEVLEAVKQRAVAMR